MLIRSIQMEASMVSCSSTCPNHLSAFGFWLRPVYSNGSHLVCLSLSVSCAISVVHNAQQETEETARVLWLTVDAGETKQKVSLV